MNNQIHRNYQKIQNQIEKACQNCGRKTAEISLMAVSKTYPLEDILAARAAGCQLFGESRVGEASEKLEKLSQKVSGNDFPDFHLIGHLQRNKIKKIPRSIKTVQSIDKIETAESLNAFMMREQRTIDVLLQYNISAEQSKYGINSLEALYLMIEKIDKLTSLSLKGLMTIGPMNSKKSIIRKAFAKMYEIRELCKNRYPAMDFSVLSMGMSFDFEEAIKEGSTLLRIGSAIFGQREYK